MSTQIRRGVFETNSSSSHSISISNKSGLMDTIGPDDNGVITLVGGKFGWEVEDYDDARTKANYCIQDIAYPNYDKDYKVTGVSYDEENAERLIRVIKAQTGCEKVVFDDRAIGDGYVDHQSAGTTEEAFRDDNSLRMFIFNKHSILHTDNDNH